MKRVGYLALTFVIPLLIFARALAPAATPTPKPPFTFKGKTVTILVPWSVGGTADLRARVLVRFTEKYFPGNPTVIVQNMPGGGGMLGDNWVYQAAPKDGTFIGQPSTLFANAVLLPDKVKYDLSKWQHLGAVISASPTFVHANLGIKRAEEIGKVTKRIHNGITTLTSGREMISRLFLKLMGADHKLVTGYGSSADMRAAIQRGELEMTADGLEGYYAAVVPLVKQGLVVPFAQDGLVRGGKVVHDPRLSDVPLFTEVLVKLKGEDIKKTREYRAMDLVVRLGNFKSQWIYPPGVSKEIVPAMAAAFEKILADPEVQKAYEESFGFKPIFINAAEVQKQAEVMVKLLDTDPEAAKVLLLYATKEMP